MRLSPCCRIDRAASSSTWPEKLRAWRDAVVYEIYIRSLTDRSGDGVGDIAGIRSRLRYLRRLGVNAVWIAPWYRSTVVDGGYDVADHRDIDPLFGTLAEAEALIGEVHEHGSA